MKRFACSLLCLLAFCLLTRHASSADDAVNFTRDIQPILSDRCFICHGPDAERREADLRLDVREWAVADAIVPGDPLHSPLVERVNSRDADLVMPPPESNLKLTAEERRVLSQWILEGAQYDRHWAFEPLRPAVSLEGRVPSQYSVNLPETPDQNLNLGSGENAAVYKQNISSGTVDDLSPIDLFVRERLAARGVTPAPEADKLTLIRRLSFDLTGLPPTVAEADAFLGDSTDSAYERLVDRLLASDRFGERMAVDWLDVARYADTYGYQNDRFRPMWPWRDWVVDAFNQNLPYDQFIRWQLAGDLLPNATREQILATAFNRNHRQTNEGGSVEEEFRAEYVADRVNTFGAAFLGLTLECCRCHDHKYDPISQREYYQFAAFFNNIDESGLYSHFTDATPTPTLALTNEKLEQNLAGLQIAIQSKQAELDGLSVERSEYLKWRSSLRDVRPLSPTSGSADGEGASLRTLLAESLSKAMIGDFPFERLDSSQFQNRVSGGEAAKTSENPGVESGKVNNGLLLSGENNVSMSTGGDFSRNQPFTISLWMKSPELFERAVVFHRSQAWTDSASQGYELLIEDGRLSAALIHFWPGNAIRVVTRATIPAERWMHVAVVYDGSSRAAGLQIFVNGEQAEVDVVRDALSKNIVSSNPRVLTIGQRFRDVGFKNGRIDEFKVFNRALTALELKYSYVIDALPANTSEVLHNASEPLLEDYFLGTSKETISRREELQHLRSQYSELYDPIPEIMVMEEQANPRSTFVLMRGAYDAPGEQVERGLPANILPRSFEKPPSRLDLADWLLDPQHPLTSRVAVNRFWQGLFGRGLVSTAEDFGLQGSLPTHPDLLDWLAADFIDSKWDIKRLLKTIVMSATYRQCSNPTPELLESDPENEWLARGPAVRLPAEMIRDAALYSSGLLVEKLGGPPAKPYQPDGLWKEKSGLVYNRDAGEGSHRRSLYTYWKRTSPPPSMMTFDASNREVCVVRRQVTMTPLQMLVLLNDPQYVEAAKSLAEKAMLSGSSSEEQLVFLFRSMVTRAPSERERSILLNAFQEQLELFSDQPEQVDALLQIGDYVVNAELDRVKLAAWTVLAEGLMSFDETVMKR